LCNFLNKSARERDTVTIVFAVDRGRPVGNMATPTGAPAERPGPATKEPQ